MKTVGRGKQEGGGKRGKGGGICETQFSCSEEMDRTEGVAGEGRVYGRGGGEEPDAYLIWCCCYSCAVGA